MFLSWVAVEFLVELVVAPMLLAQTSLEMWYLTIDVSDGSVMNSVVN